MRATEGALATLRQQNEALQRDVDRFQQRERLLKEARARVWVSVRVMSPILPPDAIWGPAPCGRRSAL